MKSRTELYLAGKQFLARAMALRAYDRGTPDPMNKLKSSDVLIREATDRDKEHECRMDSDVLYRFWYQWFAWHFERGIDPGMDNKTPEEMLKWGKEHQTEDPCMFRVLEEEVVRILDSIASRDYNQTTRP